MMEINFIFDGFLPVISIVGQYDRAAFSVWSGVNLSPSVQRRNVRVFAKPRSFRFDSTRTSAISSEVRRDSSPRGSPLRELINVGQRDLRMLRPRHGELLLWVKHAV